MRLPGQLPLEQAQTQVAAQALVVKLARLRVMVQAAVLELAQMQAQRLVSEPELELALGLQLERELPLVWVREPPVVWVREPPLVRVQGREPARQQEPAAVPESPQSQELAALLEQARELRVSRQMELQQHRLPTAAQERPPYLPALPMKAPCWGAPAW